MSTLYIGVDTPVMAPAPAPPYAEVTEVDKQGGSAAPAPQAALPTLPTPPAAGTAGTCASLSTELCCCITDKVPAAVTTTGTESILPSAPADAPVRAHLFLVNTPLLKPLPETRQLQGLNGCWRRNVGGKLQKLYPTQYVCFQASEVTGRRLLAKKAKAPTAGAPTKKAKAPSSTKHSTKAATPAAKANAPSPKQSKKPPSARSLDNADINATAPTDLDKILFAKLPTVGPGQACALQLLLHRQLYIHKFTCETAFASRS